MRITKVRNLLNSLISHLIIGMVIAEKYVMIIEDLNKFDTNGNN